MYAKIDRDYLVDGESITESRVGTKFGSPERQQGQLLRFRVLDDDGEVYYGGEGDDEALESVFGWAQADAGSTLLQTRGENGDWIDVIG